MIHIYLYIYIYIVIITQYNTYKMQNTCTCLSDASSSLIHNFCYGHITTAAHHAFTHKNHTTKDFKNSKRSDIKLSPSSSIHPGRLGAFYAKTYF